MENVKTMKIIAVDTSLGTNFLLSACQDATISELRGMIQKEHMACFPEHESINVGALLVDYSQRQYRVTDHLLIGQVLRKCWNKIHAVVSLGSSRAGLFSNDPKPIEIESFVDGNMRIPDGSLEDRPSVKRPEALLKAKRKDLSVDRQSLSNESPTHALLCRTKALGNCIDNCIGTAPAMMVNQDCWSDHEKFRCPLFSIEGPYTQPCSELNVITRAALSKGVLETKSKRKRRRCVEEEIPVEKQKQGEVDCQIIFESARDRESSPNNRNSSSTKEELQAKIHEESLKSLQPDTDCRNGFNGKVVLSKGEEHLANSCEAPNNNNLQQHTGGSDNYMESGSGQRENLLFTNTEAFVSCPGKTNLPAMILESHHNPLKRATEEAGSCGVQKKISESSRSEKEFSNSKRKTEEFISQISDKTGTKGCPEMSTGNLQEGTEEANLNNGAHLHQMDVSMGYPIKLNDHTILLVASLSADVVPETQESQMESQDGRDEGALEQAAVEPLYGCLKHEHCPLLDSVEPKEMEALVLPLYEGAKNTSTKELNIQVEDLAVLADKEENLNLKPLVIADQPSKSLSPEETNEFTEAGKLFDKHHDHEKRLLDASCSSDSHNISVRGKKKKYRRRKGSGIDQVLKQKDDRLVGLNAEEQGVQGGVGPQKLMDENSQLTENLIETSNDKLGTCNEVNVGESSYKLDINKGTSDDISIRPSDPGSSRSELKELKVSKRGHRRKRQKQSVGSCNESSPFAGDHITEFKKVAIEACVRTEDGGECMEGISIGGQKTSGPEKLCQKEGAGKESDRTYRKKKKRRKETSRPICDRDNGAEINNIHSNREGAPVDECVQNNSENDFGPSTSKENKELSNALSLAAIKENELKQGEVNLINNVGCEQVAKKKSKRKKRVKRHTDLEMCKIKEQDQNLAHANVNDTESLSKDGIVKSSSPVSPFKEPSQEDLDTIKQGFDVFEFESSETVNRQKENFPHLEGTSNLEADNLDKLCSVAVNFVEYETLNPLKTPTRNASRKNVHPKRWVKVLSERLTWNQTSKSSSKKQHAKTKSRLQTKGTCAVEMSSDGDLVIEACDADEEAKEGSSQVIVDDGRIACPIGCGKSYTKKTSAYYRHRRMCSGYES